MLINLMKKGQKFGPEFLEAEQDEGWVLLRDHPEGIISCGQACCYGIIVKNGNQVALAHVSSCYPDMHEFINDMIKAVSEKETDVVSVFLARSPSTYAIAIEDDKKESERRNIPYETVDPNTFFSKEDKKYTDLFKQYFKDIIPKFLSMPHDFFTINSNGEIDLYERYNPGELTFVESPEEELESDSDYETEDDEFDTNTFRPGF